MLEKYFGENWVGLIGISSLIGISTISFFTKDQAPINRVVDKFYLGWFVRLIFNPLVFSKRYLNSLKLIPMVIFSKIKTID